MIKANNSWLKWLSLTALVLFLGALAADESWARAGGGRSSGSTGSRTVTKPGPGPQQSQPTRPLPNQPAQQSGGFFRGLAGGLVGGFLGSMLFGSLFGHADAATGAPGSGIGLFDLILIALVLYLVYRFIKRRRAALAPAGASYYQAEPAQPYQEDYLGGSGPDQGEEVEAGLRAIRVLDPQFTPERFREEAADTFFRLQEAWSRRNLGPLKTFLTDELYAQLNAQLKEMAAAGRTNHIDKILIRTVDLSHAWQEAGQDYVTALIQATVVDYTVDEASGAIIDGDRETPVKFEELWTFTRPAGNFPWRLGAIGQVE